MEERRVLGYARAGKPRVSAAGWVARAWGLANALLFVGMVGFLRWGDELGSAGAARRLLEAAFPLFAWIAIGALPAGWAACIVLSRRLSEGELLWLFWTSSACGLLVLFGASVAHVPRPGGMRGRASGRR
jgi:hypothetical protein